MVQKEAGMVIPKVGEKDEAPLIMLRMLSLPYRRDKKRKLAWLKFYAYVYGGLQLRVYL